MGTSETAASEVQQRPLAKRAFDEYMALGPSRSIEALVEHYRQRRRMGRRTAPLEPTLRKWAEEYDWPGRVQKAVEDREAREAASMREEALDLRRDAINLLRPLTAKARAMIESGEMAFRNVNDLKVYFMLLAAALDEPWAEKEHRVAREAPRSQSVAIILPPLQRPGGSAESGSLPLPAVREFEVLNADRDGDGDAEAVTSYEAE